MPLAQCPPGLACACNSEFCIVCAATTPLCLCVPCWPCCGARLRQRNKPRSRTPSLFTSIIQFAFCTPCAIYADISPDPAPESDPATPGQHPPKPKNVELTPLFSIGADSDDPE